MVEYWLDNQKSIRSRNDIEPDGRKSKVVIRH